MINTKDVIDYLEKLGYRHTCNDYICGALSAISMQHDDTGKMISIDSEYSKEYLEELEQLPEGTEFIVDYSRCISDGCLIPCILVTESGFLDGSKDGIILKDNSKYHGFSFTWENLKKAMWILDHLEEHMRNILKAHISNLELIDQRIKPLNKKHLYICEYDPMLDVSERENSHLYLRFADADFEYAIGTNAFDGGIYLNDKPIDLKNISDTQLEEELYPPKEEEEAMRAWRSGHPRKDPY